jgi:hypothetical protein
MRGRGCIEQHAAYPKPVKKKGEYKSHRAAADDGDWNPQWHIVACLRQSTLPGFNMPFGSSRRLMSRISSIATGSL